MDHAQAEAQHARDLHRYQELERRYQQLQRATSSQVQQLQDENRELQALTEQLLSAKETAEAEGVQAVAEREEDSPFAEEASRLRERVQELEQEMEQARSSHRRLEELEVAHAALQEEYERQLKATKEQNSSPGKGREVAALQAELRAVREENSSLEKQFEEKQDELEHADRLVNELQQEKRNMEDTGSQSKASPSQVGEAAAHEAEVVMLRAENTRLSQRCRGLAELAEQACTRAEQVRDKFEQAAQMTEQGAAPKEASIANPARVEGPVVWQLPAEAALPPSLPTSPLCTELLPEPIALGAPSPVTVTTRPLSPSRLIQPHSSSTSLTSPPVAGYSTPPVPRSGLGQLHVADGHKVDTSAAPLGTYRIQAIGRVA